MPVVRIDLSHRIEAGMQTYPGLPGPVLREHVSRADSATRLAPGVSFEILALEMVANTGTYLDAPRHYHAGGADVADLALDRLVEVPLVLVEAAGDTTIGPERVPAGVAGCAVLFHTSWSRFWGTPAYADGGPHLGAAAVEALVAEQPALVGIDALNIDALDDLARPAHSGLLAAGIPIVEHLTNLDALAGLDALRLTVLPAPFVRMGTFPVRAVAVGERGRG